MTHPTSLRLDVSTRRRLQDRAEQEQVPAATVALRLIDEGLRMAAHPGVVFRAGPAGRRPALGSGPDVAEVVSVIHHLAETGDEAEAEAARWLELPQPAVRSAVNYYVEFTDEIDELIAANEAAADEAELRWQRANDRLAR